MESLSYSRQALRSASLKKLLVLVTTFVTQAEQHLRSDTIQQQECMLEQETLAR